MLNIHAATSCSIIYTRWRVNLFHQQEKFFLAILFTAGYIKVCVIVAMTSGSYETIAIK